VSGTKFLPLLGEEDPGEIVTEAPPDEVALPPVILPVMLPDVVTLLLVILPVMLPDVVTLPCA
jgi:hypothetical protein